MTTSDTAVDAAPQPADPYEPAPRPWRKLLIIIGGLAVGVALMVLAFLAPAINSGPHELPIAVSGPAPAVSQLTDKLGSAQPGAFEVTTHDSPDSVTEAVHDRDAIGGIAFGPDGTIAITTAGGAGAPYAGVMQKVGATLEQSGAHVTYHDVAPLTADDPTGAGLTALALPMAFGGMISAVLLSTQLRHRPWLRVLGSAIASLTIGFVVIAILQFGFGTVDGNYVATALALALGTAAISLFVLGLESLLGYPGLGIGGLTMIFIANPLSGMATGWQWLPHPWGLIGQLLPPGATGTLIRSAAFFGGHGSEFPVIVLCCWIAVGVTFVAIHAAKRRRERAALTSAPVTSGGAAATA